MRILVPCLAALALTVGCGAPEIRFDYDSKANYLGYRTYDWYAAPRTAQGARNPIVDTRVRRAVDTELAARGFRREITADPDFLVTYQAVYQPRRSSHGNVGIGLGLGGRGLGLGVGVAAPLTPHSSGQAGAIILEIQDFKTHQLVWKAVADDVLDTDGTPEEADADVAAAVKKMLNRFPPSTARP